MNKKIILNKKQIENSIIRLSFEIIEQNINNTKICLIGLEENGYNIAKRIKKIISKNCSKKITTIQLKSEKNSFKTSGIIDENNDNFILIDDVLKSGKTIIYAIKFLLEFDIKKL